MITFCEWLTLIKEQGERRKFGLYPPGYDGIGFYPLAYFVPASADVMFYMDASDLMYYGYEGSPFKITHIPGKPKLPSGHNMPGTVVPQKPTSMPSNIVKPKDTRMPGRIVRPTQWYRHPETLDNPSRRNKNG